MKKRIFSFLLIACLLTACFPLGAGATSIPDINASSVFVKQLKSDTCTYASNVMMFRRGAIINGDTRWDTINEADYHTANHWNASGGMTNNPTALGMKGTVTGVDGGAEAYKQLLKEHPEGIVIYFNKNRYAHAVLLTDYNSSTNTFYCADPASSVKSGRIPLAESSLRSKLINSGRSQGNLSTQDFILKYMNRIWYIYSGINYHVHNWDKNGGYCTSCKQWKPNQNDNVSVDTSHYWTSKSGDMKNLHLKGHPYSGTYSGDVASYAPGIKNFQVLSAVINGFGNKWYYVKAPDGKVGYTYCDYLQVTNTRIPVNTTISISGATIPSDMKQGSKFGVRGVISSAVTITSVTAGVFTSSSGGTMKTGKTVSPNALSYNLNGTVNNAIVFNTLPVGTYWYRVTATNSGGTSTLINQKFSILANSTPHTTHTKGTFQFFEATHPHYNYYKCSVCGQNFTDGTTHGYYENCTTCNPPKPVAPVKPTVSITGNNVTVSWNDVANETSYDIYLVQSPWGWNDIKYSKSVSANVTTCTFSGVNPGAYNAFIIARPNADNVQSGWAEVQVQAPVPTNAKVVTDKTVYTLGETVTMTPSATGASHFYLSVREAENESNIVYPHFDPFNGPLQFTPTKPGNYVVYIDAANSTGQQGHANCTFTVNEPVPTNAKVVTDKSSYSVGETVIMTPSATGVTGFALSVRARYDDEIIYLKKFDLFTGPAVFTPTQAGDYAVWIDAYNATGQCVGARSYFTVEEEEVPLDPTPENSFIDVPNGAYFADAVNWAVDKGITAGTSSNTFSPNQVCTRAQAVTFLWRAAGSPEPSGSSTKFVDVANGQYYTKAVQWAVEKGITGGTSANTFSPNDKCTRAQIVTFLYRLEKSPTVNGVSPFADVPPTLYYANAVAWAVENGITSGTSASTFSPHNDCSRGQIVTFLYRDMG